MKFTRENDWRLFSFKCDFFFLYSIISILFPLPPPRTRITSDFKDSVPCKGFNRGCGATFEGLNQGVGFNDHIVSNTTHEIKWIHIQLGKHKASTTLIFECP